MLATSFVRVDGGVNGGVNAGANSRSHIVFRFAVGLELSGIYLQDTRAIRHFVNTFCLSANSFIIHCLRSRHPCSPVGCSRQPIVLQINTQYLLDKVGQTCRGSAPRRLNVPHFEGPECHQYRGKST